MAHRDRFDPSAYPGGGDPAGLERVGDDMPGRQATGSREDREQREPGGSPTIASGSLRRQFATGRARDGGSPGGGATCGGRVRQAAAQRAKFIPLAVRNTEHVPDGGQAVGAWARHRAAAVETAVTASGSAGEAAGVELAYANEVRRALPDGPYPAGTSAPRGPRSPEWYTACSDRRRRAYGDAPAAGVVAAAAWVSRRRVMWARSFWARLALAGSRRW